MGMLPPRQYAIYDFKAANLHVPAADTDAVITLAAVANRINIVHQIIYSYSEDPTGGNLLIADGGTTVFDYDIVLAEPHPPFDLHLRGDTGAAVVITLAAGGGTAVGKLHVISSIDEV